MHTPTPSGRAFPTVFVYLPVECPFNEVYGIDCRAKLVRNCSIASFIDAGRHLQ
jgi:hypothetical protein